MKVLPRRGQEENLDLREDDRGYRQHRRSGQRGVGHVVFCRRHGELPPCVYHISDPATASPELPSAAKL